MSVAEKKKLTPKLEKLIEVTEQLIEEKGCNNTTLADIIRRSGLSKGGIYHYVKSKDELYGLILQRRMSLTDLNFQSEASQANAGLDEPVKAIVKGLPYLTDDNDIGSEVFIYLFIGEKRGRRDSSNFSRAF